MHNLALKAAAFGVFAATAAVPASAAVTITGSVTGVTVNSTDPGLVIQASPLAFPTFTLNNVGDFAEFDVLTIGTSEGTVNFPDDFAPQPISVAFSFSRPAGVSGTAITGTTTGFVDLNLFGSCGVIAGGCGSATFGAPSQFVFNNGGRFSVGLSNVTFPTPGSATVTGRFTLLAAPVPEPSTWALMLLGFGAIGAAMRSPARRRVSVSYA